MNVGNVEIRPNHPVVIIGVAADPTGDETGAETGGLPVTATMVKARAQSGHVRIRLWFDVGPAAGSRVFDGLMTFPAGVVHVCDVERVSV